MTCTVEQRNKYICGRLTYREEKMCYIHIRKWIQTHLKSLGIKIKFPRKTKEIENGLRLIRGVDPKYVDKYNFNIIHLGVMSSDIELVKHGIKLGVDINGRTFPTSFTPLYFANFSIDNIIPLLLKAGADVFVKDINGVTFLEDQKESIHIYSTLAAKVRNDNTLLRTIQKNYNLSRLPYISNTIEYKKWRNSIISQFVNRLPNIKNRGALFDIFYEYFEFCHILCVQYA